MLTHETFFMIVEIDFRKAILVALPIPTLSISFTETVEIQYIKLDLIKGES